MDTIPSMIRTILQPNRSARCFGTFWMDAVVGNGKQRSMKEIRLTNTIWPLLKSTLHSCKVKKRDAGGCSYPTGDLLLAVIRIIYLRAVTRFRKGGSERRKEV